MPIRPENVARYPDNWDEISLRIRQRDNWCCRRCGVRNGTLGGRVSTGAFWPTGPKEEKLLGYAWPEPGEYHLCFGPEGQRAVLRIIRIVLTVAHLDHTPENCADDNLESMCQRCHNIYDLQHRRAGIFERGRAGNVIADLFG